MWPTTDQGLGILLATLGIGVLLWLAAKAGFFSLSFFGLSFHRSREKTQKELEWDREDERQWAVLERRQVEAAFVRYGEAAVGLAAMVNAPGPGHEALTKWFDLVAGAIDAAVTKHMGDNFRVAVWADFGDADAFRLIGCANHDTNDPKMHRLSKTGTIGGLAWRAKSGEYLCADISKDKKFKARSPAPRPYKSLFAIRVGDAKAPWGVLTIDAPRADGFTAMDLSIIRRFARLVSTGAVVALAKYSPGSAPGVTPAPRGPARIVQQAQQGQARLTTEEMPDDQP